MPHEPTIDFDHHSAEFAADSTRRFASLRAAEPVSFSEAHGGFWVAASYELVREILSDSETYTVERSADRTKGGKLIPASAKAPSVVPGVLDGEPHDRLRRPLRTLFAKPNIERTVGPVARRLAAELLDELEERDQFDFATEFSFRLTVNTIFEFVGLVEVEDREKFILMLEDAFAIDPEIGADRDNLAGATSKQYDAAEALVRDVVRARTQHPTGDLISHMVADGSELEEDDVVALTLSMILGGVRTTAASLDNMVAHLASHPELREELAADPSLIPAAVEEMLRYFAVTPLVARTVTCDTELGGVALREGDRIAAVLALANLDEAQFPDPDDIDTERSDGMHLTFGLGNHYCLGLWLARLELRVAIEGMLDRMPAYQVVAEGTQRFSKLGVNNGFAHLIVRSRP